MENLGKELLNKREAMGLSYSKIWSDIRIREEQVKLMESNRFGDLGVYGVAKAIVYNYAKYLELDLDAVIREFHRAMPEFGQTNFHPQRLEKEKHIMLSTNFLWMIGIMIFVVVLGTILLIAYRNGYLKTPEFSSKVKSKNEVTNSVGEDQAAPDSLRNRMLKISENIAVSKPERSNPNASKTSAATTDTTDYVGEQMGKSPINVEIK